MSSQQTDIVFHCGECRTAIIRNSREHDECITKDDKTWYCGDCAFNHLDDDSDSDEEDEEDVCERCGSIVDLYVHPFGCIMLCAECGVGQCPIENKNQLGEYCDKCHGDEHK